MYRVVLERAAKKQAKKVPKQYKDKIEAAIAYLAHDPFVGKKLKGDYRGKYSLRIWPYRIIYSVNKKKITVYVLALGHRQGVYKQ
jgi:mRNA interferase RelE/StbE